MYSTDTSTNGEASLHHECLSTHRPAPSVVINSPCKTPMSHLLIRSRWILSVIWLFVSAVARAADSDVNLPNIVVYLSDDHSYFDTSMYGASDVQTPNMAQLAADGMLFTHAFVASPACAPSRAAMLTGLMPARNGAEANHTYPKLGTHFLISDFKNAGYEVVAFGKVAHGKGKNVERVGFDRMNPASAVDALKANVAKYLQQRQSTKPLCLFVGTSNPHVPWSETSRFDPASLQLPPHHLDTPATREHRAAYYEEIAQLDELLGDLRSMALKHLGENVLFVHSSDHGAQWPFAKWNLYDYGIRVPLIVSWPGKVHAGKTTDAIVSWVDLLPTLLDLVGGSIPDSIDGRSFAPLLLGKTLEHRDRVFVTHSGDGDKNIYPMRCIRKDGWKLIHNLHPEFAHTNHSDVDRKPMAGEYWTQWAELAERDARAQAIIDRYYARPEFELYHVAVDPWELSNLVDEPSNQQKLAKMKAELAQWMKSQGDRESVFNTPRPLANPQRWHPRYFGTD